MSEIPIRAPQTRDGDAFVFVVLVRFAGGSVESPQSAHRDFEQAEVMARAQGGRVLRVPYYDGVPREPV